MTFTLLRSRHGVYYLRLLLPARSGAKQRSERRISLRTKDKRLAVKRLKLRLISMAKVSRKQPQTDIEFALEGEAEALRKPDLYARGLALIRMYGDIDQRKDPLGFELISELFTSDDTEAYFFTQNYLREMQDPPALGLVADLPTTAARPGPCEVLAKDPKRSRKARQDLALSDLIDNYIKSRPHVREGSRMSDRAKCMLLLRVIEHEIQAQPKASHITNETMRAYASRLDHMPKGIGVERALTTTRLEDTSRGVMSAKTKFSHAHVVRQFVHWLDDNKYDVDKDVLTILKRHLVKPRNARVRVSLRDEDVVLLLSSVSKEKHRFSADLWVPWLAAFTGARPAELCQLRCDDVIVDEASSRPMLRITAEGHGQQLKTTSSRREIPVHDELLARGFAEFVASRRNTGSERLFPEETRNEKGEFAGFSKRINRKMKALGITGSQNSRRDFYSLRHTVVGKLKMAGVPEYIITDITGHSSDDRPLAFTVYGMQAIPAETKHAELMKLSYGDLPEHF